MDVRLVRISDVSASQLVAWLDWLTPDERTKLDRFATDELRREYVTTRALARRALSRWHPEVAPVDWSFGRTEEGRPFVVGPRAAADFNLSNAGGLVACAVGSVPLGVDVEPLSRGAELLAGARRIFSPRELEGLDSLDGGAKLERTVQLWTLKEAYLKARGSGISVHLNRFGVLVEQARQRLDDALDGDPEAWQLQTRAYGAEPAFVVAVAAKRGPGPDLPITFGAMD